MAKLAYDGKEIPLEGSAVIGRHRSCTVQLRDDAASRQHARVEARDGIWFVEDMGSANGTLLNGGKIDGRRRLRDGDTIAIGTSQVRFHDGGAAPAAAGGGEEPARAHVLLAGSAFSGLTLEALVGVGTIGAVYKARQENLNRTVAVKVFDPARSERDPTRPARLVAEAGRVGGLRHPALVQLHDAGIHQGLPWLAMEWVEGETLKGVLAREGRLDPAAALLMGRCIAEALHAVHGQKLVHGDLRPATVILTAEGGVKLTDLGLMHLFGPPRLPAACPAEAAWYLSPEQAEKGAGDPRNDIYSLGCLLVHLLTGKPPFDGPDARAVVAAHRDGTVAPLAPAGVPGPVDAAIQLMLSKNPEWRPATMQEVADELDRLRAGVQPGPGPRPTAAPAKVATDRRTRTQAEDPNVRTIKVVALVVLVLVALGLGVALAMPRKASMANRLDERLQPPSDEAPVIVPVAYGPGMRPSATAAAVAKASDAQARWLEAQKRIDAASAEGAWGEAEAEIARFLALAPGLAGGAEAVPAVRAREQRLRDQADLWYLSEVAGLPGGNAGLPVRLKALAALRDRAPAHQRADAESRYQETLARCSQLLLDARRRARRTLEEGRFGDLPAVAQAVAEALTATPVEAMQREMAMQCREAAAGQPLWKGSWILTLPALKQAKGEQVLPAVACLSLAGESAEARRLADAAGTAGDPDQVRRREALFNREAAVLTFDDPGDLQYLDIIQGEPRLADGALQGAADDPVGVVCTVPVGGARWDVLARLRLGAGDGQAVLTVGTPGGSSALVRIERDRLAVRCDAGGTVVEARPARPAGAVLALRLALRDGTLRIFANDQQVLDVPKAAVPAGAKVRLEAAGVAWALEDLQVAGGG
ncbi:MAG: protein kinase [Planctomycetes bacterium]|nr:protein kinase [Planctomycetota bacterium]